MWLVGLIGIIGSFFMVKYREQVGDMFGSPDWAAKVGGVYNVVIIVAVILFFFSIAQFLGTTNVFLAPILYFVPKGNM